MFPSLADIDCKYVIENHGAQPQDQDLPRVLYTQSGIVSILFQKLPVRAILIAEHRDIVRKNVAKKAKFEAFVKGIRRNDHFRTAVKQQGVASPGERIDQKERKDKRHQGHSTQKQQTQTYGLAALGKQRGRCYQGCRRKNNCQEKKKPDSTEFGALLNNHRAVV